MFNNLRSDCPSQEESGPGLGIGLFDIFTSSDGSPKEMDVNVSLQRLEKIQFDN